MALTVHLSNPQTLDEPVFQLKFSDSTKTHHLSYKRHKTQITAISSFFKLINGAWRNYDPNTNIWTFTSKMYSIIHSHIKNIPQINYIVWDNLSLFSKFFKLTSDEDELPPSPEEFFKQPLMNDVCKVVRTKVEIAKEFFTLVSLSDLSNPASLEITKSDYRKAVLKYHPDRIGESQTIYEINKLWKEYQEAF